MGLKKKQPKDERKTYFKPKTNLPDIKKSKIRRVEKNNTQIKYFK